MNEIMNLEQLERLAKNPNYNLSEEQIALMERLREGKRVTFKHSTDVAKTTQPVNKHDTGLNNE